MKASKDFFSKIRVESSAEDKDNTNAKQRNTQCTTNNCLLCERGPPAVLEGNSTWREPPSLFRSDTAQVILYCLHTSNPQSKFFNLKTDIYPFVVAHYDLLCCSQAGVALWKKALQDALSHNKELFESGTKEKGKGWWGLTDNADPWKNEDPLDTQRKIVYKMYHPDPAPAPAPHTERKRLQDRLLVPHKKAKTTSSSSSTSLPLPSTPTPPPCLSPCTEGEASASQVASLDNLGQVEAQLPTNTENQPIEEEYTAMHTDMFARIRELKDEVSKFKEEFTLKRKQNIVRIQQLDELIRNVTPTIIDTVQNLEQEIVTQKASQDGKIQVAKTAIAAEGLYQIKNQWQEEMKDMRHSISYITSLGE